MSKKGGDIEKRSLDEGVSNLRKQGKSEQSARKIMDPYRKSLKVAK